ncbi:protein kinase [Streptacidiphilus sp. P02-A3a]|nr:protein kinase [Streptacidiphilus sp. P02-A3a]
MLAGRYRLGVRLGRGGMGTVWHAVDEMLDREVAVKELSVGHLAEEDLQIVQSRMKQEARAAARIKHPGVITIHDVLEQDGKPWIVMELIDGRSLAELVEQEGTLNAREAAGIGAQVLAALHRGHQVGVIHRDVKPANVLLEHGTGRVVLTDFGIATYEGDSALTRTGDLIGSPDYLAPERVHGSRPGPASDLWGLGATLFAAVEGESPFRRDSPLTTLTAVVTDPLPEPRNAGPLTPVLRALMSKDPAERPSAPDAIRMLQGVAAGDTTSIAVPPNPLRNATSLVPLVDRNEHPPVSHARAEAVGTAPTRIEQPTEPRSAEQQRTDEQRTDEQRSDSQRLEPQRIESLLERGTESRPAPRRAQPASPVRHRRIWPWLLVAGLLAALVGGGLTYDYKIFRHRQPTADTTTGPGPSAGPSTGASGRPSQTGSPAAGAGYTPMVPPGYTLVHDPSGFSFPLPDNTSTPWIRQPDSKITAINYSPDPSETYLICFAVTNGQPLTPLQHAQQMAQSLAKNDSSYTDAQMAVNQFHGYVGARWSFSYTKQGQAGAPSALHDVIEQLYKDNTGTEYDILVDYPDTDWKTGYQRFLDVTGGFSVP